MTVSAKIEPRHLRLRAIVYVRQSTPHQLQDHPESTRRQYQLVERVRAMGWPAAQVQVIDDDLGLSGASSQQRAGFQHLVAAISQARLEQWAPDRTGTLLASRWICAINFWPGRKMWC